MSNPGTKDAHCWDLRIGNFYTTVIEKYVYWVFCGKHEIEAVFVLCFVKVTSAHHSIVCGCNSGLPGDLGYQFLGLYELEIHGLGRIQ